VGAAVQVGGVARVGRAHHERRLGQHQVEPLARHRRHAVAHLEFGGEVVEARVEAGEGDRARVDVDAHRAARALARRRERQRSGAAADVERGPRERARYQACEEPRARARSHHGVRAQREEVRQEPEVVLDRPQLKARRHAAVRPDGQDPGLDQRAQQGRAQRVARLRVGQRVVAREQPRQGRAGLGAAPQPPAQDGQARRAQHARREPLRLPQQRERESRRGQARPQIAQHRARRRGQPFDCREAHVRTIPWHRLLFIRRSLG
jgi:hypothetical protein